MGRPTRQRAAIWAVIEAAGRPLSPGEVLAAARGDVPGLGMATVYRALTALLQDCAVTTVALPGGPARYEAAGRTHHHHFRCRACDRVYDVPGCARGIAALTPVGFELEGHELVLYGRCGGCAVAPAPAPAARRPTSAGGRRVLVHRSRKTSSDAAM